MVWLAECWPLTCTSHFELAFVILLRVEASIIISKKVTLSKIRTRAINQSYTGTVLRDFLPVFFHNFNSSRPIVHMLQYFRI